MAVHGHPYLSACAGMRAFCMVSAMPPFVAAVVCLVFSQQPDPAPTVQEQPAPVEAVAEPAPQPTAGPTIESAENIDGHVGGTRNTTAADAGAHSEPDMSHGTFVHDPEPPHPARVRWLLDSAITVGGFGTFAILETWVTPQLPVDIPAGQPAIGGADAAALGHFRPTAAKVSDVLMFGGVALPVIYHGVEAGLYRRNFGRRYATDLLIYAEALAVNLLVTETLKFAVDRHRPFTYLDPDEVDPSLRDELVEEQAEVDSAKSFPSGHASMSFAAAVAGSTLLTMKLAKRGTPQAKAAMAVTWIASVGLASTTAALRVVAGKHYPSDVTAGALIGTTIGAVIPLAHLRPRAWKRWSNVDVVPSAIGVRGLAVQGQF